MRIKTLLMVDRPSEIYFPCYGVVNIFRVRLYYTVCFFLKRIKYIPRIRFLLFFVLKKGTVLEHT